MIPDFNPHQRYEGYTTFMGWLLLELTVFYAAVLLTVGYLAPDSRFLFDAAVGILECKFLLELQRRETGMWILQAERTLKQKGVVSWLK